MKNNEKVIYEIPHIGGILREKGYTSKSYNFFSYITWAFLALIILD